LERLILLVRVGRHKAHVIFPKGYTLLKKLILSLGRLQRLVIRYTLRVVLLGWGCDGCRVKLVVW
jgi:hypothetical protein